MDAIGVIGWIAAGLLYISGMILWGAFCHHTGTRVVEWSYVWEYKLWDLIKLFLWPLTGMYMIGTKDTLWNRHDD